MDRLIYISAVGMRNIEQAQTARANNLANASTHGFRSDLATALSSEVQGHGYRSRVYGVNEMPGIDMSNGAHIDTGRDLDLAVSGAGLFTLQAPDGSEVYTRSGAFQIDGAGRLMSDRGLPVMGRGGLIALPPFETIHFGADGTVTIRPQGQGPEALVQIDRLKLVDVDEGGLTKDATGHLVPRNPGAAQIREDVIVRSGFLESSNVNPIHELTEILTLARQFELEVQMLQNAQTNDEAASQLLRIG